MRLTNPLTDRQLAVRNSIVATLAKSVGAFATEVTHGLRDRGYNAIVATLAKSVGAICVAFTAICLPGFVQAAQPLGNVELPQENQDEDEVDGVDQQSADVQIINQLIYRDRGPQRALKRAQQNIAAGQMTDGFRDINQLLEHNEDHFVWADGDSRLTSIRHEVSQIFRSLSPAQLQSYETFCGAVAGRLLDDARRTGNPADYEIVGRRFFYTAAGFEAVNWQGSRWLDLGRFDLAARLWEQLVSEPVHRRRLTPLLLLKAALAHRLSGNVERADAMVAQIRKTRVPLRGRMVLPEQWLAGVPVPDPAPALAGQWPMPLGDARRNGVSQGTAPYLKPLWTLSYQDNADADKSRELLDRLFNDWQKQQRDHSRPASVANSAIVVGGKVVFRDFDTIRALDPETGKTLWSYRCGTSLSRTVAEVGRQLGNDPNAAARFRSMLDLQQAYIGNAALGTLVGDDQRVYAVDFMQLTSQRRGYRADVNAAGADGQEGSDGVSREVNRLIALPLDPAATLADGTRSVPAALAEDDLKPVWSVGGPAQQQREDRLNGESRLAGHFFLGPPLPVDGRLFAVTEWKGQLNLVALEPETGELLWSQGIGFVGTPIELDGNRYSLSCSPSYAEGIVVCPTQLGILVGVDAVTGSLQWAYYYGDELGSRTRRGVQFPARQRYGHLGFPSLPQILGQRIIYMPRQSRHIHCVDLTTGRRIWRVERDNVQMTGAASHGDEYVATITDETVLVVGGQRCRGLSLENGEERWSVRLGMPSGIGIRMGPHYLVPLEEGRIATLEIGTGQEIGFSLSGSHARQSVGELGTDGRSPHALASVATAQESTAQESSDAHWKPGNLVATGDIVLSAGPQHITAYAQAGPLLKRVRDDLKQDPSDMAQFVLAAELELMLGRVDAAKADLAFALRAPLENGQRDRAESMMRQLLYFELANGRGDEVEILQQLDRLAQAPAERGRYLMKWAETRVRRDDFDGLLQATGELAELDLELLPMAGDSTHQVSAASWAAEIIGRAHHQFSTVGLTRAETLVNAELRTALDFGDTERLSQFLSLYSRWPQAAPVRRQLADRLIDEREFQRAEFLLLENRASREVTTAADAIAALAGLWDRLGLYQESAALLDELNGPYASVRLNDGRTGRQFVEQFPKNGPTWLAYQQRQPLDRPVTRVRISEERWFDNDPKLEEAFGRYRNRLFRPHGDTFQILDKGTDGAGNLAIIDNQSGLVVGNVNIPPTYASLARTAHVGHFFPLGSSNEWNGISLLEYADAKPLWTTAVQPPSGGDQLVRVGPVGPTFCTFQTRQHLTVLDPVTGQILWRRSGLDPTSGLINDPYGGMVGDDEVLAVFAADHATYTVYRTATGEELRHGKLDLDADWQRRIFGRRLAYVNSDSDDRRFRVWDALENRVVFDEPAFEPQLGRLYTATTPDDEYVMLLPSGRLRILDVNTATTRLEVDLPLEELTKLNYMRVFSDHARYYVNFQRASQQQPQQPRMHSYYTSDAFLPADNVQGDLYAVDRATGKLLWKRTLPQRSIIRTPHCRLPFLVTMCRQADRYNQSKTSLLVEVIDGATGETIGLKENIFPDRILQFSYDVDQARVELRGLKTTIRLDFPEDRLSALPEPVGF